MTDNQMGSSIDGILAQGGGNATAAGVGFQAQLGAVFASQLLAERQIDSRLNLDLGGARIRSLRFETEAPVDDILIETDAGGWIFVQAKTSLTLSTRTDSELGKTAEQIVRLWLSCSRGRGERGWDRPLRPEIDRVLLAVGPNSAATVAAHLGRALISAQATGTAALPQEPQNALETFANLLRRSWERIEGQPPNDETIQLLLRHVTILPIAPEGADRTSTPETLVHVLENSDDAFGAFIVLARRCEQLMSARLGSDAPGFRQALVAANIPLLAPPSFTADVAQLRRYSARVESHLDQYEETKVGDVQIKIDRPCTDAVAQAALDGALLLVGEPGAGKSAVVSAAAKKLRDHGYDVIELAVDRLPVESLEGLKQELGLSHSFTQVLMNWPGERPAFLFVDALDATRGGSSEAVFRALIRDVLSLPDHRWRIIASIRTFDLRLGEQFRELFRGAIPDPAYADLTFSDVRHVHVPPWSSEELDDLLAKAPRIAAALQAGGERLRALAGVPFNTRLLADLISGGLEPAGFGQVTTQAQLLDLYWRNRVNKLGSAAELCLRAAVSKMIATRTLSALRLDVAETNPAAFDKLRGENVLILLRGDQYVAFRHHILFDYATSRLYLRADDLDVTAGLLESHRGLGLMLAPALAFALQGLWSDSERGHIRFWEAVGRFAGDSRCDPIARSVCARTASELPQTPDDVRGFLSNLSAEGDPKRRTIVAFGHVVGALAVRVEDNQLINAGPWCELAAQAGTYVGEVPWSLRTLLYLLIERTTSDSERSQIGEAARALFRFALDRSDIASQLAASAIDFVASTYSTDIITARDLLRRLFLPERFEARADQELPSLARKVTSICEVDPDFLVEIYQVVFGRQISDTSKTSLGNSQIMPLSSNRRQDYDMARFSLKEFFPRFLQSRPIQALNALMQAMAGYAALEHELHEPARSWTVSARGREARIREDLSHIWAWNPDEEHADNTLSLLKAFVSRLRSAESAVARAMIEHLISQNELAVIWARTLLIAAERPDIVGDLLWPFAVQEAFLLSPDTSKDAIDFVAARYPLETTAAREAAERIALSLNFFSFPDPERARRRLLETLFGSIGADQLVTDDARQFVSSDQATPTTSARNRRPFEIESFASAADSFWWLRKAGVDVDAPANARFLAEADEVKTALGLDVPNKVIADLPGVVIKLQRLRAAAETVAPPIASQVAEYASGIVSQGVTKISGLPAEQLRVIGDTVHALVPLLDYLAALPFPETTAETEASFEKSAGWGSPAPRIEAAQAIMNLCRFDASYVEHFRPTVERLLDDPHPAVRLQIADHLTSLWVTDQPWMWRLADRIAREETNRAVLKFFANYFLSRVVHHDPPRVEALTLVLGARNFPGDEAATEGLREQHGSLMALLWISHGRVAARAALEGWLADAPAFDPELRHAIAITREALVLRYGTGEERDAEITRRAQEFAAWTVEATAGGLEGHLERFKQVAPSEADRDRGTAFAKLLNNISDQFYFASGAFRHSQGGETALSTNDAKRAFLSDTHTILHRIADAGTPSTIHHLIELLEFLIPANPPLVFDLVAHALLGAGKRHGYQFESLGADRFVAVIGRFLADHRELFADNERRQKVIACLDAFMEAGWPSARRLLYRLPELLQ